jgi:hypothetical protein
VWRRQCVEAAVCRGGSVWRPRCVEAAVCGDRGVLRRQCVEAAVYRGRGVSNVQRGMPKQRHRRNATGRRVEQRTIQ